jgi:Fe-S-cluster containining protein
MQDFSKECVKCGLCCIYYPTTNKENLSDVSEIEVANLPKKLYAITRHKTGAGKGKIYFQSKKDSIWGSNFRRCKSLHGTQGVEVSCSIYEQRPKMCSDYVPGNFMCNSIRQWGHLKPLGELYIKPLNEKYSPRKEIGRLNNLEKLYKNSDPDTRFYSIKSVLIEQRERLRNKLKDPKLDEVK